MSTVLITGGTGFIGKMLSRALAEKNYEVILLTRGAVAGVCEDPRIRVAGWNTEKGTIDREAIARADYIIHLAGAGVAEKRWTARRKKLIRESRTETSALLLNYLKEVPHKVKTLVSASAIGWYGPDPIAGDSFSGFTENDPPAGDFLGQTCRLWEESIDPVQSLGIRLVKLRIGIVLGEGGGVLREFSKPLRYGIAAILGNGRQVMSWIHIDDLVRLFIQAMENNNWSGSCNAVAPNPVTSRELVLALARARNGKRFIRVRVPSFLLKLYLGGLSTEVLKSTRVRADKIQAAGFEFLYPELDTALQHLRLQ